MTTNNSDLLLDVKNLRKYFNVGKDRVLKAVDDVSFSIPRHTTLGLVGESGCGKTTVGRTLMRIYEPDGGQVIYNGRDIAHLGRKEGKDLTRKMQMVFQDPYASLNPYYTVGEIVSEGMKLHRMYHSAGDYRDRVYELLDMVGLHKEHYNRFPHEFSGGQRQRVGIARALALDPEFVVCDEAISALDVSIQAQIINMLMDFQEKLGLTYLFIAHDLSMVRHVSDRTAVMYVGHVVEYGDTTEVYDHALHPYTQGLLSAVPVADPIHERTHQRITMEGEVPSPVNPAPGCRFCGRCRHADKRCATETPELRLVGPDHWVACHHI